MSNSFNAEGWITTGNFYGDCFRRPCRGEDEFLLPVVCTTG
jgi:hypothetical protein